MFKATLAKTVAEAFATRASVRQRDAQIAIDKQNAKTNAYNAKTNGMNAQTNAAVGMAQIKSLISGSIKTAEETSGIKIDNKTKAQLNQTILKGLGLDNIDKNNKNKAFWWNFGFDKAEQLSRIGVNASQMFYNIGAGSEKFTKAASPGHYLLGW